MMASKFLHDEGEEDCVLNDEWATSAHMDVAELNELERNFIAALVRSSNSRNNISSKLVSELIIIIIIIIIKFITRA